MLDGHDIVRRTPGLQDAAFTSILERKGFAAAVGKRQTTWRAPMVQRVDGSGRWMLRAPIDGGCANLVDLDEPALHGDEDAAGVVAAWRGALARAGPVAPRFSVRRGDVLCLDNYRMTHAREPHVGERKLWRVWAWTGHRMHAALPANCLCMCSPLGRNADPGFMRPCPHCPQAGVFEKVATMGPHTDSSGVEFGR